MAEEAERVGLERDDEVVRKLVDPRLPSQEEVERHYLMGHLPYRNWCPVCVRAKVKDGEHRKSPDEDRGLSEVRSGRKRMIEEDT